MIGITRDLDMSTIDGCFSILAIRSFEIKKMLNGGLKMPPKGYEKSELLL